VLLNLKGELGARIGVEAASLGGGRICITGIDGVKTGFRAEYPTVIMQHRDKPGQLKLLVDLLADSGINVANLYMVRHTRGGRSVVVAECDQNLSPQELGRLHELTDMDRIIYLPYEGAGGQGPEDRKQEIYDKAGKGAHADGFC
jgi:L-serine dehydratase